MPRKGARGAELSTATFLLQPVSKFDCDYDNEHVHDGTVLDESQQYKWPQGMPRVDRCGVECLYFGADETVYRDWWQALFGCGGPSGPVRKGSCRLL